MERMASTLAPGWFPDPGGYPVLRWWDGRQWTDHTSPLTGHNTSQVPPEYSQTESKGPPSGGPASANENSGLSRFFGGRRRAEAEVERLQARLDSLGVTERDALAEEVTRLQAEIPALRAEHDELTKLVEPLRSETARLQRAKTELGEVENQVAGLRRQQTDLERQLVNTKRAEREQRNLLTELGQLRTEVVETQEAAILQEVGIYQYRHPLDDAIAYKARLTGVQAQIKDSVRAGNAVTGSTNWTVNGSVAQGRKMVREFSKLMLRAYNAEADNAVRTMKPYTLQSAIARLEKSRDVIVKLGGTMNIRVTDYYHHLRVAELELTADYLAKVAEEKEQERAERERIREEEKARREIEREQERLRKEQQHYQTVLAAYRAQGDTTAATEAEAKLAEIDEGLDGLSRRAANVRAGYVYVISNTGSFGPRMVKVGVTRRLNPEDRIRELGDASVPFRYDVHALVFDEDAVGLEAHLHRELNDRRVNLVNPRREFFYATPAEIKDILSTLNLPMLSYVDEPEALEWHQSESARKSLAGEVSHTADAPTTS